MKRFVLLGAVLIVGCSANPRYRTGGEEAPRQLEKAQAAYDTNDYLRLGGILQEYLGKPYKGKSKYEEGLDCSHFTQAVFKRFDNIKIPRMAADQYKAGRDVKYRQLAYGDLVFFRTDGRKISHVGVYIGEGRFIHVSSSSGVIISSLSENYWADKYAGARRILE